MSTDLRAALWNLVAMVEENGPDYADADAMRDARRALGVGLHEVIELGAQGYRSPPLSLHPRWTWRGWQRSSSADL